MSPFVCYSAIQASYFCGFFIVLIREIIKNKTGVAVDQPDSTGVWGTTTPHEIVRKFLYEAEKQQILVDCITEKVREDGQCDKKVYD